MTTNSAVNKFLSIIIVGAVFSLHCTYAPEDAASTPKLTCKDSISVYMALEGDMFGNEGHDIGFNYELLKNISQDIGCAISIFHPSDTSLICAENGFDIIIKSVTEYSSSGETVLWPVSDRFVWTASDLSLVRSTNAWLGNFKGSGRLQAVQKQYFTNYSIESSLQNGVPRIGISPYDDIIKRYSSRLGWDWKLLSAIVYCESKFALGVTSHKGATGLMQIRPSTGKAYGIQDIHSPENNIDAGTRHLKYLQSLFIRDNIDSTNLIKFTLAAYNAGEGRIEDCRNLAKALGKDPCVWEEVASVIPLMKQEQYYNSEFVQRGKFSGTETIKYVEKVLARYDEYLQSII